FRYQGPSCIGARGKGSKGDGTHLDPRRVSAMPAHGHASTWNWQVLLCLSSGVKPAAAVRSARLEHSAGRHQAGFEVAPQRYHDLACKRHDGDAPHAPLAVADALAEGDA